MEAMVLEEQKRAKAVLADEKTDPRYLYDALTKGGLETPAPPAPPPPPPHEPDPDLVYGVAVGDAPIRGSKDALVTIVQFSDFTCGACRRVEPVLKRLLAERAGQVRIAWKDRPLAWMVDGALAARAGRAAAAQGKFWEMHDALLAQSGRVEPATLERLAGEIGLDVGRFKRDLRSKDFDAGLAADLKQAQRFAVFDAPGLYVNGRYMQGAVSFEALSAKVEEVLPYAREINDRGVPASAVYQAIIAHAMEQVDPPTLAEGAAPALAGTQGGNQ
jgi:protein-disulfide isomerase